MKLADMSRYFLLPPVISLQHPDVLIKSYTDISDSLH